MRLVRGSVSGVQRYNTSCKLSVTGEIQRKTVPTVGYTSGIDVGKGVRTRSEPKIRPTGAISLHTA